MVGDALGRIRRLLLPAPTRTGRRRGYLAESDPHIRNHGTKQADARGLHVVGVGVFSGKIRPVRRAVESFAVSAGSVWGEWERSGPDRVGKGAVLGLSGAREAAQAAARCSRGRITAWAGEAAP